MEETKILSAETDTSGFKVFVACNNKIIIPDDYTLGFTLDEESSSTAYSITNIAAETSDSTTVIIELDDPVIKDIAILLTYSGTLMSTDSTVLAPVTDLPVKNNSKAEIPVGGIRTHEKLNC